MSKKKSDQEFPREWNESRVRRVLNYYESQTDEEAATEIRSALENTTMEVPTALVPLVRELIAKPKVISRTRDEATKHNATASEPRAARAEYRAEFITPIWMRTSSQNRLR